MPLRSPHSGFGACSWGQPGSVVWKAFCMSNRCFCPRWNLEHFLTWISQNQPELAYIYGYLSWICQWHSFDELFATHAAVTIHKILLTKDPAISTRLQPLGGAQKSSSFQVSDVQCLKPLAKYLLVFYGAEMCWSSSNAVKGRLKYNHLNTGEIVDGLVLWHAAL